MNIDPSGHSLAGGITAGAITVGAIGAGFVGAIAAPAVVPLVVVGFVIGSAIGWLQGDGFMQSTGDAAGGVFIVGMLTHGIGDGAGAGGGGGSGGGGGEEVGESCSTSLYRVVEQAEHEDIQSTGSFNPSPSRSENKYSWGNEGDARQYVNMMERSPIFSPPFTIYQTWADPSLVDGPVIMDGMPAYTVPNGNLGTLGPPLEVK